MEQKLLLLGLLDHADMHGYQINELIHRHLGSSILLTKPTVYRYLGQLEEKGLITSSQEQEGNRPVRQVYSITPEGKVAFREMLRQSLARYTPPPSHSTIPLAFLDIMPAEEAVPLLEKRRQHISRQLGELQADNDHAGSFSYMISNQVLHLAAELDWLNQIIDHHNTEAAL